MPLRNGKPINFRPKGLVDAYDATEKFNGACLALSNLVFDQGNPEIVRSRPGVTAITSFASYTTPGVISVFICIDTRVYGMIASGRNAGKDEPFCYDTAAGAFVAISGITNANSPTTPASTGPWTPPTMACVGTFIYVTHPGFPGGATKFGWLDISNPASPAWNAGDAATAGLTAIPQAVANFNNRAYFAVGNQLQWLDALSSPPTRTSSNQAVTIGDTGTIMALAGLPVQTTSAGIVQSLTVFKGTQIWQLTGDSATSNLATNYLSLVIGTPSPRSVVQTPYGLYFMSVGGPYIVDLLGTLKPLQHAVSETDVDLQNPFEACTEPTRVAAGYIASVYRISLDTTVMGVSGRNDYWFDEHRRRWNGPHTFPYHCCGQIGNNFILSSNTNSAKLIQSQWNNTAASVYTDLGVAFSCTLTTSTFPKEGDMDMSQMVESTIELAAAGVGLTFSITALDDQNNALDTTTISIPTSGNVWGSGVWGSGLVYAAGQNIPSTYSVPWNLPLVFKKMALQITAPANPAIAIGAFQGMRQRAGYMNNK